MVAKAPGKSGVVAIPPMPTSQTLVLQGTPRPKPVLLIVDDNFDNLDLYRDFINSDPQLKEYTILTASDSESAIQLFRKNKDSIAAVVTDRAMDTRDAGDRVVREIRKIELDAKAVDSTNRGVGIAMVSATLPPQKERDSIGADKYLLKTSFENFESDFQKTVKQMIELTQKRRPEKLMQ